MSDGVKNLVIGQGLAGSAMAWTLHHAGQSVMIIDRGEPATASRVSAGLITPLTGKKLVRSVDFAEYWQAARTFYKRIEEATGQQFFDEGPMLRLFRNETSRTDFLARSGPKVAETVQQWNGVLQENGQKQYGLSMQPAGRLNVKKYQQVTRQYFEDRGSFVQGEVETWGNSSEGQPVEVLVAGRTIKAERVIFCSGAASSSQFPEVPNNRSRGDILEVSIPNYQRSEVVHRSVWVAPEGGGRQLVGSTYDWKNLVNEPTTKGKEEVLGQLSRMVEGPIDVLDQRAAVRPTMKDFEPVIGQHPEHKNIFILNGLGSKGVLRAPLLADRLLGKIKGHSEVPEKQDYSRLLAHSGTPRKPLTMQAQEAVAKVLRAGETAIDGTVGNGFDTSFLAEQVGKEGQIIGFDLQQQAIDSTGKRLQANGQQNVRLIQTGHENLASYSATGTVAAVMFNLGYLPRSDKTVVTSAKTSVAAMSAALEALRDNGIMTVLAYRGHDGAMEEFAAVEQWLEDKSSGYDLKRVDSRPAKATSPVLFILEKTAR